METRNKEISLTLNELEEVAWRMSGQFEKDDVKGLENVLSVGRNTDFFDKHFYDTDMQSLQDFVSDINKCDDRPRLLQEWIQRKESEYKARINLPPKHMQLSDKQLFEQMDGQIKRAREGLVGKFLKNSKPYD